MTIETATYINQLNATYPEGGSNISTADDHLRLIKSTVKATFPNITGAVTVTQANLNLLAGLTDTMTTVLARYSVSISAAAARIETLSQSVSLVQADVARISQTVSVVIARVAAMSISVSVVQADAARFSLSISALNTAVAAVTADLHSVSALIQTSITSHTNDIARISQTVSVAVAKIASFSLSISAINSQIYSGVHTIWIPAGAMTPTNTNGAVTDIVESTTYDVMQRGLAFDAATAEYAQFTVRFPKGWDEGTVTAQIVFQGDATGGVVWGLQGQSWSDGNTIDAAWGTAQTVTDTVSATSYIHMTSTLSAITIAGAPAEGDLCQFRVYRDAASGSDTAAGDANLFGVVLFYTVNALSDA